MVMTSSVSTWTVLIRQFFPVFAAPGTQIFLALVTGRVLCTGRHTITGIPPFADPVGQHAHDAFHRFLPDAHWDMDALWKLLTALLVKTFAASGVIELDLDDTLFHRCGRKVHGVAWWRDAVRCTRTRTVCAWGLNLVVLTLRVTPPWGGEPLGLPILMRLHGKKGDSLVDLAEAMLEQLANWLPERALRLHAGWVLRHLGGPRSGPHPPDQPDATRCGSPRAVGRDARQEEIGASSQEGALPAYPRQMARRVHSWWSVTTVERDQVRKRLIYARQVPWHRVCKTPVSLLISRDPEGKERDDFFFTTDLSLTPEQVIG